jgi:hypothetical protein
MSVLRVVIASVLALSLVLGLALPALADSDSTLPIIDAAKPSMVKGTVIEVDEENQAYFRVQSGNNEISVSAVVEITTIRVDENTRYFLLDAQRPVATLLQQFRLRNQAELGARSEEALQLRLETQAQVNAKEGQGLDLGLQNRQRVRAEVQNQPQVRAQRRVAQTETVPVVEPQQARLRVQDQVVQTEEVPVTETQPVAVRPFGERAEFSDIEVGDRVVVWLASSDNLARVVLIIKPVGYASVSGTITGVSSETIEITPEDGRPVTLRWNEDTVFVLNGFISVREGQLARAVYETEHMMAQKMAVHLPG